MSPRLHKAPRAHRVTEVPREHTELVRGTGDRLTIIVDPLDEVFHDRGNYGASGRALPKRYRFLHPQAHQSLRQLEINFPGCVYYSDAFRNASGSKGRREKNRAKSADNVYSGLLPGRSGHGFGLCLDHMVSDNLRRMRRFLEDPEFDKKDYDLLMRRYGWRCHRDGPHGDHRRGPEEFHYNYFGDDNARWLAHSHRRTSGGLEAKLQYMYGPFTLDAGGIEEHLARLGHAAANKTRKAQIIEFQERWTLPPDGIAGPQTQRVLLYVGAQFRDGDGNDIAVPFP